MTNLVFTAADWWTFFGHFLSLSLMSIGGAIITAPDMHRFLVDENQWLSDPQFSASIAIAQASPGPNVLFVALLGWNVGFNAAGVPGGALGLLLAMTGILMPSSILAYVTASWGHRNRDRRAVRAFKQGMTPIVLALLIATGWVLAVGPGYDLTHWRLWVVTLVTTVVIWRTRLHLLWLLAAGAVLGAMGWV